MRPLKSQRLGFTLFELLMVVTVLAVLLSLLLPAAGMVRDAARAARCLSSLRQLGVAQFAYAFDNRGFTVEGLEDGKQWKTLITPYVEANATGNGHKTKAGTTVLSDCPAWRGNFNGSAGSAGFGTTSRGNGFAYNGFPGRAAVGGYNGMNSQYLNYLNLPYGKPMRLAQITYPATRLQFFDSDGRMPDAFPSRLVQPNMTKTGGPRHRNGVNWLFWDGSGDLRWSQEQRIWKEYGTTIPSINGSTAYWVDQKAKTFNFHSSAENGSAFWKSINEPDA